MSVHPDHDTSHWKWYSWPRFFNRDECLEIGNFIDNNYVGLEDLTLGATTEGGITKKKLSSVKHINYGQIKHLISPIIDEAFYMAQNKFGYLTNGPHDRELLNFNTYSGESKDTYDWHIDESANSQEDMKLTLLINLSTEVFEGGDFETWVYDKQIQPSLAIHGSCFMFKSHIPHRVLPVTKGTRKSLTFWITGPRFR